MTQQTAWLACRRTSLVVVAAIATVFAFGAPNALAGKGVIGTIGEGQFASASGVVVNESTGDLYSADADGQRIVQFTSAGDFVRAWGWGVATGAEAFETCTTGCQSGIAGSGDGQFFFQTQDPSTFDFTPPQLAIDQDDGSIYVADSLNNRVQKFTSAGAYVTQFTGSDGPNGPLNFPQGVAVDPVSDHVYVADTGSNRVVRFDSAGAYQSEIGTFGDAEGNFNRPTRVAVDSTGRLYVVDVLNGRVQRFTVAGVFDQVFAAGAYTGPADIGVDPDNDHVYVAAFDAALSANAILEFDADGVGVDTHAAGANVVFGGIAFPPGTDVFYATSLVAPAALLVLDDVTPPSVSVAEPTDVTADGATFHGTVNPEGPPDTVYQFEYSTDGSSWVAVPGESVGTGTAPQDVFEAVSGLDPKVEYRVRLVATKAFNAATATSSEVTFTTGTVPPLVRSLAAGSRTDAAAWLGGEVNPQNLPTTYVVEYTLADDVSYAQSFETPAADAGDGNAFVAVRQLVTGLRPNTLYRFRVVGTNAAGRTEGPDNTFVTRKAPAEPPAGRGYELVSPLDKNGADIDRNLPVEISSTSGASTDGNAVVYAAQGQFAGIDSGAPQGQYRSVRDPQKGWGTRGLNPPIEGSPVSEAVSPTVWDLSDDTSRAVVGTNSLMTPNASLLGGSWGLYIQDSSDPTTSTYQLVTVPASPLPQEPPPDPLGFNPRLRFGFAGATSSYDHVVFESADRQLTPDGRAVGRDLYVSSNGQVRFVSILPSGDPASAPAFGARSLGGQFYPGDHAISEDGGRIYFTETGASDVAALYVRVNGTTTEPVSASEVEPGNPVASAAFQAARADDGALALFTSNARLTVGAKASPGACAASSGGDAASCHDDLYLWNGNAELGERLTDLTTADDNGGGVLGVSAVADDLSRVYFVAGGVLADGAQPALPNLYAWSPGEDIRFVGTLDNQDIPVWNTERDARGRQYRDARLSDDGNRLLFTSHSRLTSADNAGHKQVYLYDFAADTVVCVSCPGSGAAADGAAWLFYPPDLGPSPTIDAPRSPRRLPRNLSADGTRVFFETDQGLVTRDANGKADVYMWTDGEIELISTGESGEESEFIDASASGDDAFFTTRERVVGADVDDQVDVYDARVGGGFPEQEKPLPCVGDQCQGPFSPPLTLPSPIDSPGAGNPPIAKRASLRLGKLSAASRRALGQGRTATLVARVNKAGRVSVRGKARLGKQSKTVMASAKRARGAGRVRLPLRLNKVGRARLANAGRLRVSLSVGFSGLDEPRTLRLTLVRGSKSGRGR